MMKQLLLSLVAIFLLFMPHANAHTYLDSTTPADGTTVTEKLQTIILNYSGKIEEGSIFKVLASDRSEMAMESIALNNGVLTGTLASPLPDDTYTVEWNSISEDGHPLSGSFSFTVNAPDASATADGKDTAADTTEKIGSDVSNLVDTLKDETDSEDDNSIWTLIIVIAIIVLVLTVLTIYSYNRWLVKRKGK
ncbi:copper resistance CopC family protein [Solibacillus silvestris]|uniref:copper resistance CopC family protein n=1 Tax=Solibacillus silvestris TaxID=76853 RepID=UPI003F80FD59